MADNTDHDEKFRREAIGAVPVTRAELLKIIHDLSNNPAITVHETWARLWRIR